MSNDGSVNSQITDAVTQTSTLVAAQGVSSAMSILDVVLAETLGMAMHNAVFRQQQSQVTNSAAITAACAKMLQAPFPIKPPPPPPSPSPPPSGLPPPVDPASDIARHFVDAQTAITALQRDQSASSSNAATAGKDLDALAKQAATPPTGSSGGTGGAGGTPTN
ncbi:MAG: RebB family R body protein [Myxococcales bacterium]|nr:RebB family R body protein [Myxococcales bacterium]